MSLESDVFRRRIPVPAELEEYGFTKTPDGWVYEKDLLAGAFRARVIVAMPGEQSPRASRADGKTAGSIGVFADGSLVAGDVIDLDTGESYIPLRVERQVGTFAAEVRHAYLDVLEDIAVKCFREQRFLSAQTDRVIAAACEIYGDEPQAPFEKYPDFVVLQDAARKKWYGLVMEVEAGKLLPKADDGGNVSKAGEPLAGIDPKSAAEILNVKTDPDMITEKHRIPGIYPAYHMNKKHWISILLDGTLSDGDVLAYLAESHRLACRGGAAKNGGGALEDHTWVIPYAYGMFNVAAAFEESPDLEWQQAARMRKGDTVYMYCGAPIKAIRYRCSVKEANVPNHSGYKEEKYPYLIVLHLEESYADDVMPLAKMRELGLYGVRGARRVPVQLAEHMRSLKAR